MKVINYPRRTGWDKLLKRPAAGSQSLEASVATILNEVKTKGDAAVKKFTLQFDKVKLHQLMVSEEELSPVKISIELESAMQTAYDNIYKFHLAQKEERKVIETSPGVKCWRKSAAIEKVGLYIPGGSAPLFSTVLMLGIPAQIAGCSEVILCTPPGRDGKINPAVLFAAKKAGINKIFRTGGAQAIAAMAYGTESIPRVYKIFGPGNRYVTCAKQLVQKEGIAIDLPAGPSELAVLADDSAVVEFVAADLLSQAEHGPDSQVLLVTDSVKLPKEVKREIQRQLKKLPRRKIAERALKNSRIILVSSIDEGIELLNEYAPEHLIICCRNEERAGEKIINAGSVFLGNYSPESAGDYASGTNHTLPTNGYAKAYSGISLDSFCKKITFQQITKKGINKLGKAIDLMAGAEGLEAHRRAVEVRMAGSKNKS